MLIISLLFGAVGISLIGNGIYQNYKGNYSNEKFLYTIIIGFFIASTGAYILNGL